MPKGYWVKTDGKIIGPFSAEQLKKMAASGKLHRQNEISSDQQKWTLAEKVTGLRFSGVTTSNKAARSANGSRSTVKTNANREPSPKTPPTTNEIYIGSSFVPFYKWGLILIPISASGMSLLALHFLFFKYFLFVGSSDGGVGQAEYVYFTSLITVYSASSAGHILFALSGLSFALMGGSGFAYVLLQTAQRLRRGKPIRERYFLLLYEDTDPRIRVEQMGFLSKYSTFTRQGLTSLRISRVLGEHVLELNCRDGSTVRLLGTTSKSRLQRRVSLIQKAIEIPLTEGPSYGYRLGRLFASTSQTSAATPEQEIPQESKAKDVKRPAQVIERSVVTNESVDSALLKDVLAEEPIPEPVDWMPPVLIFYARVLPRTMVLTAVPVAILGTVWDIQRRGSVDYLRLLCMLLFLGSLVFFYSALSSTSKKFLAGDKKALIAFHVIFGVLLLFGSAFWVVPFLDGKIALGVACLLIQAALLVPYFWYVAKCEKRFQFREDVAKDENSR